MISRAKLSSFFAALGVFAGAFQMGAMAAAEPADTTTHLFSGSELDGWSTWLRAPHRSSDVSGLRRGEKGDYLEPIGAERDPLCVFSVQLDDGTPVVRISGEVFGVLVTDAEFGDYHFSVEYRWGEAKHAPRLRGRRDSGILFHSFGPPGAWGNTWMEALECQIIEEGTGDFIAVGHVMADVAAELPPDARFPIYSPRGTTRTFRRGEARCETGKDWELAHGQWNRVDLYTVGAASVFKVNGQVAMRITNARHEADGSPLVKGRIQLQSEGAEIFFRNAMISPISDLP